jgi:hypothetical protein
MSQWILCSSPVGEKQWLDWIQDGARSDVVEGVARRREETAGYDDELHFANAT